MNIIANNRNDYLSKKNNELQEYDEEIQIRNYSGDLYDIPINHNEQDFWYNVRNRNNRILNIGFDYRNQILRRSLSKYIYLERKREMILNKLEVLFTWMVEHIKNIKKTFNYSMDKKYRDFN